MSVRFRKEIICQEKFAENANITSILQTEKEFYCSNTDSDNYGIATMYDDSCEDFEEKDD